MSGGAQKLPEGPREEPELCSPSPNGRSRLDLRSPRAVQQVKKAKVGGLSQLTAI